MKVQTYAIPAHFQEKFVGRGHDPADRYRKLSSDISCEKMASWSAGS